MTTKLEVLTTATSVQVLDIAKALEAAVPPGTTHDEVIFALGLLLAMQFRGEPDTLTRSVHNLGVATRLYERLLTSEIRWTH